MPILPNVQYFKIFTSFLFVYSPSMITWSLTKSFSYEVLYEVHLDLVVCQLLFAKRVMGHFALLEGLQLFWFIHFSSIYNLVEWASSCQKTICLVSEIRGFNVYVLCPSLKLGCFFRLHFEQWFFLEIIVFVALEFLVYNYTIVHLPSAALFYRFLS